MAANFLNHALTYFDMAGYGHKAIPDDVCPNIVSAAVPVQPATVFAEIADKFPPVHIKPRPACGFVRRPAVFGEF